MVVIFSLEFSHSTDPEGTSTGTILNFISTKCYSSSVKVGFPKRTIKGYGKEQAVISQVYFVSMGDGLCMYLVFLSV